MRTTEMLNFRVYPGVIRALEMLGGRDPKQRPSMRSIFENVLMGYLNAKRKFWEAELNRATKALAFSKENYDAQFAIADEDTRNTLLITAKVIAGEEAAVATAERELARLLDIQKTAFPDMAVNDEPKEE